MLRLGARNTIANLKPVSFHFRMEQGLVLLPITVNGKVTFRVALDTGMPGDGLVLFNSNNPKVKELGLHYTNRLVSAGGDRKHSLPVNTTEDCVLDLPGLRLPDQVVYVVEGNPFRNIHLDGLIGYALFSRFVVQLNFTEKYFRCWHPGLPLPENFDDELPLTFRAGLPYLPATAEIARGKEVSLQAFLDLGSPFAFAVNSESRPEFAVPPAAKPSDLRISLGGSTTAALTDSPSLTLGGSRLLDVPTAYCKSEIARCADKISQHEGNIGTVILRRFHMVIDYSNKRLLLKQNLSFSDPFAFDTSDINLRRTQLGHFLIEHVNPDSVGGRAGLKANDIILRVNGEPAHRFDPDEMERLFISSGENRNLIVARNRFLMKINL